MALSTSGVTRLGVEEALKVQKAFWRVAGRLINAQDRGIPPQMMRKRTPKAVMSYQKNVRSAGMGLAR
jgi:hypothetical protein